MRSNQKIPSMHTLEVKGNLAKLLATENLVVSHKAVPTASFDVDRRELVLPIWERISNTVYDLLVGHEVGHALFTPNTDLSQYGVSQGYVNVTEDVRIEKLMKRKYPGLRKSFYDGYKELNAQDFFDVENIDLEELSLADRINLHFKVGNFVDIPFSDEEMFIRNKIELAETFEDAVQCARILQEMRGIPEPSENLPGAMSEVSQGLPEQQMEMPGGGECDNEDIIDDWDDPEDGEGKGNDDPADLDTPSYWDDEKADEEDEFSTQKSFDHNLESMATQNNYKEINYFEIPKVDYDDLVVSNKEIRERCEEHYRDASPIAIEYADEQFRLYKKSATREVNYLVKEFECKKSAAAYARATTSKSGVLDTLRLHSYKYNDDIFKRITVVPDGKSHGLVALIDWSGSIADSCLAMCKQVLNIAWFCKKVQIPFNAYLFSCEWGGKEQVFYRDKPNMFAYDSNFHLLNILTTDCNTRDLDQQARYLYYLGAYFSSYTGNNGGDWDSRYIRALNYPIGLYLGGTPLNEAIVSLHCVIPYFKDKYGVEKLNVVVLTDGEAHAGAFTTDQPCYHDDTILSTRSLEYNASLRNRSTGRTFQAFTSHYLCNTKIFLEDVRDTYPDTNIVAFRIIEGRDVSGWIRAAGTLCNIKDSDAFKRRLNKEKTVVAPCGLGYDEFYLFHQKSLNLDTEFEVADNATKVQIKNAFKKSLGNKSVNKKVLSSFIGMVA